ncbi:MAG: LysR family transcriptional regulator substrate-binding protein [Leptolyngbyaceae cyanobacterium CRU_2_3]|nr:LysR family transcriptional regulator substrate-binding protein [Leptolyngbyaceae cyanobacterium CRU_2_3]
MTYPFISEVPGNIGSTRLNQHLRQCGITLNPAYEIREDATRISMVAQGLGATIVPQVFPEPIPSDIQVCQLPIPLERSICATTLTAIPQSPAVAVLLDIFFETARS